MKNFLRIVMFLIIVASIIEVSIFLTNQNTTYITNDLNNSTSKDIDGSENIFESSLKTDFEISGEIGEEDISGEFLDSGENLEIDEGESGEQIESSGDETEILSETISGENLDEISGEVSGDISNEIREE